MAAEGVGLDDIGTSLQIAAMDIDDDVRTGQVQHVIVALHLPLIVCKPISTKILLTQAVGLNKGSHRPIEDENSLPDDLFKNVLHVYL